MKNLQEATERICELKGSMIALDALLPALIAIIPLPALTKLIETYEANVEVARTAMLHADISDLSIASFEVDVERNRSMLEASRRWLTTAALG